MTCPACNRDMTKASTRTCPFKYETLGGKVYRRLCEDKEERCGDCGIVQSENNAHHPGCHKEICPACGGQALGCECMCGPMYKKIKKDKTNMEVVN